MSGKPYALRSVLALSLLAAAIPLSDTAHACACCGTYRVVDVAEGDALNVRLKPSAASGIVIRLGPGEGCIMKTGKGRGGWVEIEALNIRGWVAERHLAYIR